MKSAPQALSVAQLFAGQALLGQTALAFSGLSRDSRHSSSQQAYVAMGPSPEQDQHVSEAIARGATTVVSETRDLPSCSVPLLLTSHARWSFSRASVAWHGLDKLSIPLLAVTGTAGKSTITHCAWWAMGAGAARIGTIGWHDGSVERSNSQTTPPPEQLHSFLAALPSSCVGVAMELSSHAGDQQRSAGLTFSGLVFTGLGHDHLDYHRTSGAYLTAKLRLIRLLKPGAICIINADDPTAFTVAHAATAVRAKVVMLGFTRGESRLVRSDGVWRLRHGAVDYRGECWAKFQESIVDKRAVSCGRTPVSGRRAESIRLRRQPPGPRQETQLATLHAQSVSNPSSATWFPPMKSCGRPRPESVPAKVRPGQCGDQGDSHGQKALCRINPAFRGLSRECPKIPPLSPCGAINLKWGIAFIVTFGTGGTTPLTKRALPMPGLPSCRRSIRKSARTGRMRLSRISAPDSAVFLFTPV
jgi:hypothetical protein